jgi:hypothetical protein
VSIVCASKHASYLPAFAYTRLFVEDEGALVGPRALVNQTRSSAEVWCVGRAKN